MTGIIFSFVLAGLIAVLWFGAIQVQGGAITPGAMTQFVMYAFVAVSGIGIMTETYAEIMRAAGATERLMELLAAESDITPPAHPAVLAAPVRGLIFITRRGRKPLRFATSHSMLRRARRWPLWAPPALAKARCSNSSCASMIRKPA